MDEITTYGRENHPAGETRGVLSDAAQVAALLAASAGTAKILHDKTQQPPPPPKDE